jgi:hypothetical protein
LRNLSVHWKLLFAPVKSRRQIETLRCVDTSLFANENKNASGERHDVKKEDRWPEIQAEPAQDAECTA